MGADTINANADASKSSIPTVPQSPDTPKLDSHDAVPTDSTLTSAPPAQKIAGA